MDRFDYITVSFPFEMILTSNRYQIYNMKTGKKDIPVYEAT
jgi:hypothetical protein